MRHAVKRPIDLQGRNYSFVSPQAQQEIRVILVWDTILTWDDPHTLSLKCSTSLGKAYGDVILTENGPLTFVKHSDVTHYTRENTILDRNDPHTNCSQCVTLPIYAGTCLYYCNPNNSPRII